MWLQWDLTLAIRSKFRELIIFKLFACEDTNLSNLQESDRVQRLLYVRYLLIQASPSPLCVGFHELIFARFRCLLSVSSMLVGLL